MYQYSTETQLAIRGMAEAAQPFDLEDIKALTEAILDDDGKYYDPIIAKDLKTFMLTMFEKGNIVGYCLTIKYACDEKGPKVVLEFVPENGFATLDLIKKPEPGFSTKCNLHKPYKELLKYISKKAGCSQDMMIRSILVRSLDMINDQLK